MVTIIKSGRSSIKPNVEGPVGSFGWNHPSIYNGGQEFSVTVVPKEGDVYFIRLTRKELEYMVKQAFIHLNRTTGKMFNNDLEPGYFTLPEYDHDKYKL